MKIILTPDTRRAATYAADIIGRDHDREAAMLRGICDHGEMKHSELDLFDSLADIVVFNEADRVILAQLSHLRDKFATVYEFDALSECAAIVGDWEARGEVSAEAAAALADIARNGTVSGFIQAAEAHAAMKAVYDSCLLADQDMLDVGIAAIKRMASTR